jgi:hypothetical protein
MILANPVATKPVLTNQERGIGLGDSFSRILFCFMIMLVASILIFAKAWEAVRAENLTLNFLASVIVSVTYDHSWIVNLNY